MEDICLIFSRPLRAKKLHLDSPFSFLNLSVKPNFAFSLNSKNVAKNLAQNRKLKNANFESFKLKVTIILIDLFQG